MDLGQCPRCGVAWAAGLQRCRSCGFVPIGAGLDKLPKKKKKRVRPYREGGAVAPWLFGLVVLMGGYYAASRRPWENNFEEFRIAVLGQSPPLKVQGDWEVTKLLALDPKTKSPITAGDLTKGKVVFHNQGKLSMNLHRGGQAWTATGRWVQAGERMVLSGLESNPPGAIESSLPVKLAELDAKTIIATIDGKSVMYLRRLEGRDKLARTLTYKMLGGLLKPGQSVRAEEGIQ